MNPIDTSLIAAHNERLAADADADYRQLGERLARRGIDIDAVRARVAAFGVAIPSWGVGTGGTRFARFPGPGEPRHVFDKLTDCAVIHQLGRATPTVSLHIPWDKTGDYTELREVATGYGLTFDAINSNTFSDQKGQTHSYKFGSLTHSDAATRAQAVEHNLECIEIGRALGSKALTVWIGDGSNFPGQQHFRRAFERYLDSTRQIYAALPSDWRMFLEHKICEPAFYATVIQDWGSSYLAASALGAKAQCLVDLGHHAPNVNIELIVARLIAAGRLAGFHFNDSKYGDDDLDAGSVAPYRLFLVFNELVAAEHERVAGFRSGVHARPEPQRHRPDREPARQRRAGAALVRAGLAGGPRGARCRAGRERRAGRYASAQTGVPDRCVADPAARAARRRRRDRSAGRLPRQWLARTRRKRAAGRPRRRRRHCLMLTAVVDIGKTHSRLAVLDRQGDVVAQHDGESASTTAAGGWRALDTAGTEAWLFGALSSLGTERKALRHLVVTTHGAAVAALAGEQLAWPVADYEFEGFDERPAATLEALDPFEVTLSPVLPRGLNMGLQLDWFARHEAAAFERADTLLPYPQYWAWRLSGVAASEVSSLGCHTLLWQPHARAFSPWARDRGFAQRFAPLRFAWEGLGTLRPELAHRLGLSGSLLVHTGAHDSNACLARWLRHWPRLTLVSSGTWLVVMALGSVAVRLDPENDELANVSVRNEPVPTARFMGGRELHALCAGADPALADLPTLDALLARALRVLPAFETQGGPFRGRPGELRDAAGSVSLSDLTPRERATAAALYVAQMTARTIERLGGAQPVVLEGPFAHNPVIVEVLAALLPPRSLHVVDADLEGTVRGGEMLARWTEVSLALPTCRVVEAGDIAARVRASHRDWLALLGGGNA